jgi:hypothetical protein
MPVNNGRTRAARAISALLLTLAFALVYAGSAEAEQRIKVGCTIYDTNQVDPIAFAQHMHRQLGNTSTTNASTADSLMANRRTSCNQSWFTSAGWFPVEQNETVSRVAVYYRAPGDQTKVQAVPKGLQLLGTRTEYRCDNTSGEEPFQDSPPYGCRSNWDTKVTFGDCWNRKSLEEQVNGVPTTVASNNGVCPRAYPYRMPKTNYLIQHPNSDGRVPNPLTVSAGTGEWEPWDHMHADYLAANQPVFNDRLLDLCLRDAPDSVSGGKGQPDECGVGVRE